MLALGFAVLKELQKMAQLKIKRQAAFLLLFKFFPFEFIF